MILIQIDPGWLLLMALLWYLEPWGYFLPFCAAMAVHELGHILALRACGIPIRRLRLDLSGAVLETGAADYRRELFCALAGPAVNLLSLAALPLFPGFAHCGLLLALFNLLPIPPLDGGRALRAFLLLRCSTAAAFRILTLMVVLSAAVLMLAALCLTVREDWGLWPVAAAGLVLLRMALSMKKHL